MERTNMEDREIDEVLSITKVEMAFDQFIDKLSEKHGNRGEAARSISAYFSGVVAGIQMAPDAKVDEIFVRALHDQTFLAVSGLSNDEKAIKDVMFKLLPEAGA